MSSNTWLQPSLNVVCHLPQLVASLAPASFSNPQESMIFTFMVSRVCKALSSGDLTWTSKSLLSSHDLLQQNYYLEKCPNKKLAVCQVLPRRPSPCSSVVTVGRIIGLLQFIQILDPNEMLVSPFTSYFQFYLVTLLGTPSWHVVLDIVFNSETTTTTTKFSVHILLHLENSKPLHTQSPHYLFNHGPIYHNAYQKFSFEQSPNFQLIHYLHIIYQTKDMGTIFKFFLIFIYHCSP